VKVLYDIATLGLGYYHRQARAGIFRVVENVARALVQSGECEIYFSAVNSVTEMMASAKYLSLSKEFATIPFRLHGSRKALALATRLHPTPGGGVLPNTWLKVLRIVAKRTGLLFPGIDADMMSGIDIFHSTFAPLYRTDGLPSQIRRFITVYDIIPILHPEYFECKEDHVLHDVVRSIQPDDFVLAISQATKHDLCEYSGINPDQVFVTPLAASDSFYHCSNPDELRSVREKYRIPDCPYVLSLSTLEPRKNIAQTIRCFTRLVKESGISDLNLVLVGTKGWDYGTIFDEMTASASVRNRIILTGYVADEDLAAVYSGALMFVYPSFYEGFGLPPLEAMRCGVPVITSNTSSLPEVVGDAGIMIDPTDSDALCQGMLDIYTNTTIRQKMIQRSLERASLFSWKQCAQDMIAAYHMAIKS